MRVLAVVAGLAMAVAPDGGVDAKTRRHDISLAEYRCDQDGGTYVERVHDCRVACVGGIAVSTQLDGGACVVERIIVNPSSAGDFWGPGEWPFAPGGEARWPQR